MERSLSPKSKHILVMAFGSHIFRRFILFPKRCIGQFLTVFLLVHGPCVWLVCGQFLGNSKSKLGPIVAYFYSYVWTICCAYMLDCVLIYVDICVFRYIDMDGCKSYVVDIIIHDTEYKIWYEYVSYSIHPVAFCIAYAWGHRIK